jgi:hypothetical protein
MQSLHKKNYKFIRECTLHSSVSMSQFPKMYVAIVIGGFVFILSKLKQ